MLSPAIKKIKSFGCLPTADDVDFSTPALSYTQLDAKIMELYQKFNDDVNNVSVYETNNKTSEEREIEKVMRLIRGCQTPKQVNQIVNLLSNSKFPITAMKVRDHLLDVMTRPSYFSSTSESHIYFQLFIPELHRFLIYFSREDQSNFLEALSNLIVCVSPNPQKLNEKGSVPSFQSYEAVANCCTSVLRKCFEINYPQDLILKFSKSILSSILTVSVNIAEVSRIMHSQFSSNFIYIGSFFPFVSELEPLITANDSDLVRLLQQFWIVSVMFTFFGTRIFLQWDEAVTKLMKFIPPLVQKTPRVDFSSIKVRVNELFKLINPSSFKQTENLVPVYTRMLPNLPTKTILQLDVADAIYGLSIFTLEKTRAENGIIGPMFEYIEAEYTPTFSQILDAMFEPIFSEFEKYFNKEEDIEQKHQYMAFTMSIILPKIASNNVHVQTLADQFCRQFALSNPTVICHEQVLKTILSIEKHIQQSINEQQRQTIHTFIETLFSSAVSLVPNSLFALLFYVEYRKKTNKSNSKTTIIQMQNIISKEYYNVLLNQFMTKSISMGKAEYITPENFDDIKENENKSLTIASYIILHPERIDLISKFLDVSKNDKDSMLLTWTHFANNSISFSKHITSDLIHLFMGSILNKTGIFGFTLDLNVINFQTTTLRFLIEQILISSHSANYISIFSIALDSKFLNNSAIVPSLISFAYFGCLLLNSNNVSLPIKLKYQILRFVIRMLLISYSYTYDAYIFRYINETDLVHMERIIEILPETTSLLSTTQNIDQNTSSTVTNSTMFSSKNENKIPKTIGNAINNSTINFISKNSEDITNFEPLISFTTTLLCNQLQLFYSYLKSGQIPPNLQRIFALYQIKPRKAHLNATIPMIWKIAPEALYNLCLLPRIGENVISIIAQLSEIDPFTAASIPSLALLFATNSSDKLNKSNLSIWKPLNAIQALTLVKANLMKDNEAAKYVSKCLASFTKDESLLFLPQLVQSLRFDSCGMLRQFLIDYSKQSEIFLHYLLWNILSEKGNSVNGKDNLPGILTELEQTLIDNMSNEERIHYENEFGLIDKLDEVSQRLLPMPIENRPPALGDMLNEMEIPDGIYIPSNPNYKILSIDAEHSVPLKSHARVPILVRFKVYDENDEEKKPIPFSCIFKIHDDVRQDAMMIQFIDRFQTIFNEAGLDTYLFPYRVFATGENRGVLECIPNAKSRHDLGHATNEYFLQYFISKYGPPHTKEFKQAQQNFIKSVAPYSLLCYLFQVKDRHNANIMVDEEGHIIHIDFGFLFEISPGGNLKFERAPFKLTREMIDLMGGSREAPPFQQFATLLKKCFFAVRARHSEIESITYLMMSAGFPCFRADSIKKLQQRFFLDKSPKDVCVGVEQLITESYEAPSTSAYDGFQAMQNGIFF
ncbi:phosphatidylinositol 4-kinase [Histomonas meleagridis]|uniref:phosphatidylinositol 4-kinase n=1 Tax=Histomonas meleagridis TaxID=135588 RepID=UPI003559B579|nr:phosphatidylinositol 4-kinase [Histomonas meleagridis]KAH0797619.1 phosphatidylinositol 4-kinase [Histomonas meleagridis]